EIEHSPYMAEQGKYPVIFITFKDIKERNWKDCFTQIKILVKNLYNSFEFVRSSLNPSELVEFDNIWLRKEEGDYRNALKMLSFFLKKYYQTKVIILIDEYD
ncbi:AAA family ATPase, partial [Fusobacterium necrophorum]